MYKHTFSVTDSDRYVHNRLFIIPSCVCVFSSENAYNILVKCGGKIVGEFSKDPKGLALSLHGVGFISDDTLDKTNSLNEINRDKARRLHRAVLGKVKYFPHRYAELVSILEQNRTRMVIC